MERNLPRKNFFYIYMELTAGFIAEQLHGQVVGDSTVTVRAAARIEQGKAGSLCFLANPKYEHYIYTTKASVVLVNDSFVPSQEITATLIRVPDAYQGIAQALALFTSAKKKKGREFPIYVSRKAKIGRKVYIGAHSYIAAHARIGNGAQIYPQVYIGEDVKIGVNTVLYPGVKIYHGCIIGDNCIIHANSVIGADGFGFAPTEDGSYKKIPQTGIVTIEDRVEVGANTTIDRATMGTTLIHQGVKLDNHIQVAHNVEIGENTVIAAHTGIAGSSKVGKQCMIGGQVGIAGHLEVADGTQIGAQTGVIGNVKGPNAVIFGTPAIDHSEYFRAYALFRKAARNKK